MRVIDKDEVEQHRSIDSIWMTSEGLVYDVTEFTDRHPGGVRMLLDAAGTDVQRMMTAGPHKHSNNALKIMQKYVIGKLPTVSTNNGNVNKIITNESCNNRLNMKDDTSTCTAKVKMNGANYENNNYNIDDLVNLDEAMILQVGKLGNNYERWAHTFQDKDLKFFNVNYLEWFTKCQWYFVPIIWVPIVVVFLYLSYHNFCLNGHEIFLNIEYTSLSMPFIFSFGFILWTFFEYMIHRFLFHLVPPANSPFLMTIHFLFHGQHHKNPMNKDRLVFPPIPAAPFAFVIYHICQILLPLATSQCVIAGISSGYIFYDLTHYYLHHGQPTSEYWKDLKHYHMRHHYFNPDYGFGISSKLWDYPFGTLFPKEVKQKYT